MNRSFFSLRRVIDRPEGLAEPGYSQPARGVACAGAMAVGARDIRQANPGLFRRRHVGPGRRNTYWGISKRSGTFHIAIESGRRRIERMYRATSMDCAALKPGAGGRELPLSRALEPRPGATRVDMDATGGAGQTRWISNGTVSAADPAGGPVRSTAIATTPPDPVLQPGPGFADANDPGTARGGAIRIEASRGLGVAPWASDEFLLVGQQNQQG